MQLVWHVLIYTVVMFLITIVYTGQHHSEPKAILQDSMRKTIKFVSWSVVLVLVMQVCFYSCID